MKLVVYDELPEQSPPRRTSLPSWAAERKDRISKASARTSMSPKRKSTAPPLRISAPSEFRKVDSWHSLCTLDRFSPLELSIHSDEHRLSDLPSFENYRLPESPLRPVVAPPKAVCSPRASYPRSSRPGAENKIQRKPVGSGPRRASLATLEQLMEHQVPIISPLIPHFSTRASCSIALPDVLPSFSRDIADTPAALEFDSEQRKQLTTEARAPPVPRTPTNSNLRDRPLPPLPFEPPSVPARSSHRPKRSATSSSKSTRSSRVAQWLFTTGKPSHSQHSVTSNPSIDRDKDKDNTQARSRTLSGSTAASSLRSWTGAGNLKTTPSLSSAMTAVPTRGPSLQDTRLDKDSVELPSMSRPSMSKYAPSSVFEERGYPTISEEQQMGWEVYDQGYGDYARYRESAVGLAF